MINIQRTKLEIQKGLFKHGEAQVDPCLMPEMLYRIIKSVPIPLAKVPGEALRGSMATHPTYVMCKGKDHSMTSRSEITKFSK
jgi:hypothetical protein